MMSTPEKFLNAICLLAIVICSGLTGCSMCCGPYDYHYPTFGGKHQRVDPVNGRVGSIFSDPNVVLGPSSDSNLTPHPPIEAPRMPADDETNSDLDRDDEDLDMDNDLDDLDDDLEPLDSIDKEALPDPDSSEVTASRTWRHRR